MSSFDDVDLIVQWIRDRITLPGYKPKAWASADLATVKQFAENKGIPALFLAMYNDSLTVTTTAPRGYDSVMYYVKNGQTILTPANIKNVLQFGTVEKDVIASLLHRMDGYYLQRLQDNWSWPESVQKEFTSHFFRFMSSLTETVNRGCGKTVLYLPPVNLKQINHRDKDFVQQLESIVIHWTRQIKEVINNQDNVHENEGAGPLEEIKFWEHRTEDLSGITDQLNRDGMIEILEILRAAKSSYLQPFETLSQIIKQGSTEANDNLRFLRKLVPVCEEIASAQPHEIPLLLPKLLNFIRLIWMYSSHYNTDDRITSLLRKVSNEIINVCCKKISVSDILDGNVEACIHYLDKSIQCGVSWKQVYRKTSEAVNRTASNSDRQWNFDETGIFAQIDAFVQRCRELLEVCEGQVQFGRKISGGAQEALPAFGGTRSMDIVRSLNGIEAQFERHIDRLRLLNYNVLDVKNTSWHSDFNFFKNGMKDLEAMTQNVIIGAFESISTVAAGVDMIQSFKRIAKREAIKRCIEKRMIDIIDMFKTNILSIRNFFEKNKQVPQLSPTEPQFSGAALWARSLLLRVTDDLMRLQELADPCNTAECDEAQSAYDGLRLVVNEYIQRKYHDWIESLNAIGNTNARLEIPLMTKAGSDATVVPPIVNLKSHNKDIKMPHDTENTLIGREKKGLLQCNFDRFLLNLFAEAQYWQYFNGEVQIPYMAHDICNQKEQLRVLREHVMLVVRDYNRILLDLSSTERRLFQDIIRKLDRRIQPGLQKLTWVSRGVVEWFVADCRKHCESTYKIVQDFQENKNVVIENCRMISGFIHIFIERNTIYDDGVFEAKQILHREETKKQLREAYQRISSTMTATYEHFASGPPEVRREWNRFAERSDKMLEDALRQSVKKSLQELSKAINGDAKTDPRPLFRIHVVLEDNKVEFRPFMADLTQMVNMVAKEMFNVISVVPRLVTSLPQQQSDSTNTNAEVLSGSCASADENHPAAVKSDGEVCAMTNVGEEFTSNKDKAYSRVYYPTKLSVSTDGNNFHQSIFNDEEILKVLVHIMNGMSSSATELQKYLGYWDKYKLIWNQDKQAFIRRYAKANRPLQQFRADIERYREQQIGIQNEDLTNTINFIQIDTNFLKASLVEHTVQWIGKLTGLLNQTARGELKEIMNMMKDNTQKLQSKPVDMDHLSQSLHLLQYVKESMPGIVSRFEPLQHKYDLLAEFDVQVTEEEQRDLNNLKSNWEAYEAILLDATTMLHKCKVSMKQSVQDSVADLNSIMTDLRAEAEATLPYSGEQQTKRAHQILADFQKKMESARSRQDTLRKGLKIFNIEEFKNDGFVQTEKDLELLQQIWTLTDEWEVVWASWKNTVFYNIEVDTMESTAAQFYKKVLKYRKEMTDWHVWSSLKNNIEQFRHTLPLIQDLKSPALRARHWAQLKDEMGKTFDTESASFTLERVFSLKFHVYADFISTLSSIAGKELSIEQNLDAIERRWAAIDVDITDYKGTYHKIRSADDLFTALEDDQVQLSAMKASPFFESFGTQIRYWEKTLSHLSDVIETLLSVQRSWMYLESIFMASEDIRKQLPLESLLFDEVNSAYCRVTDEIAKVKNALKATQEPGVLETMVAMQEKLDRIQKCLNQYLETKRILFPRFYFLSNDDLLEILGHQKDPDQVQKHIKKCFEAIKTLSLIPPGTRGNQSFEASGMISPCGEQVMFASNVVIAGAVETWLLRVEAAMVTTLEKIFAQCFTGYKGKKEKWIKDFPGQLLITCGQTVWTNECIKALNEVASGERKALKQLKKKWISYLNKLADMVRGQLSATERRKVVAVITTEIHSRDVIDRLIKQICESVNDFDWLMQLRFYFNKDLGDSGICEVKQTVTSLQYSYEYQGNNGRLVITPLTDRCVLTMTTALHLNRGGNPLGPAGTGKTETVKDLGKNLANDGLDYKSVGRMFAGLVQSGGWGCFDEFNRIEVEVLSVVAQQVLTIMQALAAKNTQVMFLGSMMRVNSNMGIFITMNPGYAGRSELPDNLKALMRPCAMMVPDLALIAEVMLQAEGFRDAKILAKKTTTLYGLMNQQLSKQDHYDFGLRSLKAVLNMAGTLKREDPNLQEENILFRALRDMNLPKFVSEDSVLFELLLGDLFPSIEIPVTDYGRLQGYIEHALVEHNLQVHSAIVFKTIQLYESQVTRHCNMIVGQTMAGKSTIWKTLMAAKTLLATEGVIGYLPVRVHVLNPKSISLNEIYGVYDLSTFEWIDGILSAIFRNLAADDKAEEKWIMLDGPVDTLWIESMNSVMDDNKVLTLINGNRISMSPSMALMFEVQNLAVASPATVSRAGMIYMDVENLGWRPIIQTWLATTIKHQEEKVLLQALLDKYLEKVLRFKASEVTELISVTTLNSVMSFCNLYRALVTAENGLTPAACGDKFALTIEKYFLFCLTWSVLASANEEGRKKFDICLRDIDSIYPPVKTVYDFFVEPSSREFKLWDEKLPQNFKIAPNTPFHNIIIPTIDTLRYGFLLQTMLAAGINTLLVGETGVGKTTVINREIEALCDEFNVLVMKFSSATSSATTQDIIESVMEKRSMNRFGPVGGKKLITFIDDMNMPTKDLFGSQPPLELLRQWIDYSCWYDRKKQTIRYFHDMQLVTAMGPPGGGRSVICSRFQSRFNLINVTIPEQAQLKRIFETMLVPKLAEFDNEIKLLGGPLVAATIQLYQNVVEAFLPTPANCHYLFNLRDIARVIQGLLLSEKYSITSRDGMLRLWLHENLRVFSDRLTSVNDRQSFKMTINDLLGLHFQTDWGRLLAVAPDQVKDSGPLFSYISATLGAVEASAQYTEVMDMKLLKKFVEEQLENYNAEPGFIPMNLVLFSDALLHILRIHRQLMTMRGSLLLVGVGGSGRQSLTKLAAFMGGLKVFQIEVGKNYRSFEFHEDIKKLYTQVGLQQQKTVFFFSDTQIKNESFIEDLNNILSSGEIPGLFEKDEQAGIVDGVRLRARAQGVRETKDSIWNFFINEVRRDLHVVLALSPIGTGFRSRCRQFPSLVNNTSIDWFDEWPLDALQEVGMKFLEEKSTGTEVQRPKIAAVFAVVHSSVMLASSQMKIRMKRHNYVTPTNYLSLVTGYVELLSEKAATIRDTRDKLKNGLAKLEESRLQVEEMSKQLEQRKVVVAQKNKDCSNLLVVIVSERRVADEQKKQVESDSERISKEEAETKKIADDAEKDLNEALPALQHAMMEVENLDKKAIAEVKVYTQPPEAVSMVMCAVMILFGLPPTWASAKTKMNDVSFLQQIKTFDKDSIRDKTVTALKKYTTKPAFNSDAVRKVSSAAGALCSWVLAMECYAGVFRVVAPKKDVLRRSQQALAVKQKDLQAAKESLQEVIEKVETLKKQYDTSVSEKNALREEAELLELKLSRAEQLVKGLAGERERWVSSIAEKDASLSNVIGDALVAAAFISYAGPFDTLYRVSLVDTWMNRVTQQALPLSSKFTFIDFLADPIDVRNWNVHGLPNDSLSTENGVITMRSKRWPLMIDPQGQANKWIKSLEGSQLLVVNPMMKDLLRKLGNGISFGLPVLMQDILEELDPSLEPILKKSIVNVGNREVLRLGDKELDYNREFRFFLTTKLPNPHYTPEISTKTTIVNYVVKEQGLEAQLLGIAIQLEEPALEAQKSDLVTCVAAAKKKLIDLENEILRLLSAAKGSLLDDEQLVTTLNASKATSEEVFLQLKVSEETEKKIDAARMGYVRVARRSSTLYFVLNDMTSVDPMYQFSLDAYVALFQSSIVKSRNLKNQGALSEELTERINAINEHHTYAVYAYACRGLFERHKLLFSMQMCARVLQSLNKLPRDEYDFLLKGSNPLTQAEKCPNIATEFLSDSAWARIVELNKLSAFQGITSSIEQSLKGWKSWYQSSAPEIEVLPGDWEGKCTELQRLLLLRCVRPDRLGIQAARFAAMHLGARFVDPPPFDLKAIYETSSYKTPLIFVLSPGVDPTNSLLALAESLHKTVENCALGQGQASVAEAMLARGLESGNWIFLANCHLMLSWTTILDDLIEKFCSAASAPTGPINPHFRLWLSSNPTSKFPIAILQRSIKMTTEPPRGLKANLIRLYNTITPEKFARCQKVKKYKRLLFCLCWFHSLLLERRKFNNLGWNIPYDFNESDFAISEDVLAIYLDEYEDTPWDALKYLIAQANYGGRVTDDWDRRLMLVYISQFFSENVLTVDKIPLSESDHYFVPDDGELSSYKNYILQLPLNDPPVAFGQHPNAEIASQIDDGRELLATILSLQAQDFAEGGSDNDDTVLGILQTLRENLPHHFDLANIKANLAPRSDPDALKTILVQELDRYNKLLYVINMSACALEKGIQGSVVITPELEAVYNALLNGTLPQAWSFCYPSLKPLGPWTQDLKLRCEQMDRWANQAQPTVFWLAGLTYPTGFLTALLQTAARKNGLAIDSLNWEFIILNQSENVLNTGPKDGAYIKGLILEGARWDFDHDCLTEPHPMQLHCEMPILHFRPVEAKKKFAKGMYTCPLYMYPLRTGTRERPSFIIAVDLKVGPGKTPEFWTRRGTALLLSLST
ncbi:flagellar inner arm dynein 1 heavy chain beta [Plasmopara halstedii]|uniref:Dynein-1, subspecies f n=1 Tax=Plasmopara halstedii TaxID=4781 RepID=A0A0P1ASI6_PLAHL|nr:flagellar inner arm dynein 1 heavy chain beta [Plasmopara halstedii]CEG44893.1 flagellar inner arm dynein 1 heavy chain beta [Plasmopara halstedii]|eukprot:XP_024581262.1 flagellar inner arm dynein 1 heavy chain beta [Plasmopara halstedii]